jgi:hypothetical protein
MKMQEKYNQTIDFRTQCPALIVVNNQDREAKPFSIDAFYSVHKQKYFSKSCPVGTQVILDQMRGQMTPDEIQAALEYRQL